ncbi:MAG TPA: SDR family NAD(P)-dependent oxidoreductase [Nitrososphaeraceae archaeon]
MQSQTIKRLDFSNKVVLITGGTGALGRAITRSFIECNAQVISSYITDSNTEPSNRQTESRLQLIKADTSNEEQVEKLVSGILAKYGQIHIMVNVVGGYLGIKTVGELEEKEWDKMMTINLKTAFLISKHVIPHMISTKYGKIVHISSKTGLKSNGYDSAYAASKSGLIRLVESLSEETKESNINVNCIMPSIINTEANRKAMPTANFEKWARPDDLSNIVLFLCSEEAKVITGAAIPTYGLA